MNSGPVIALGKERHFMSFVVNDYRQNSHKPAISLLLATYNQAQVLRLTLQALSAQTFSDFEIILGDDGSSSETANLIKEFQSKLAICHVWQEHKGFRKSRLLNQCARMARGNYFVLLDSDCVPHPGFLEGHWQEKENGFYLAGRRVDLGPKITQDLQGSGKISIGLGFFWKIIKSGLSGDTKKFHRAWALKPWWLRKIFGYCRVDDMMGCNASFFRSDFEAVDGFDESFEGYFREDGDLEMRLRHLGKRIKSVKGLALIYHFFHERRTDINNNESKFLETIQTKRIKAVKGLSSQTLDN